MSFVLIRLIRAHSVRQAKPDFSIVLKGEQHVN